VSTPHWTPGTATAIGSLPGTDPLEAARTVAGELPELPYLPELPARGVGADMIGRTAALLVDSTGELRDWYETAAVVVIGKSFRGVGGQNPVEPLLARKPVVCGPHMENFRFLVEELVAENGIKQLASDQELIPALDQLLADPSAANRIIKRAETVLAQHDGANARTARLILNWKPANLAQKATRNASRSDAGGRQDGKE